RLYGGGRYLARLTKAEGGFIKGITFRIDETIKPEARGDDGKLASQADGTRDLLLKLIEKLGTPAVPARDPMEIAVAMSQVAATQRSSMIGIIGPLIAKLSEGKGGGASASDILAAVELGIDLGGKDEGMMPVIRDVGVPLVKALEKHMEATNQPEKGAPQPM